MADKKSPTTRGRAATDAAIADVRAGRVVRHKDIKSLMKDLDDTDTVQEEAAPETVITKAATHACEPKRTNNMSDVSSILEFSEDVSTAEAVPPLPIGDYPAEIRGATQKTSQAGNQYGSVTFFIAPESYPADYTDGDPDGTILSYNRVAIADTPAARHRLRKFIEAIGAKGGTKIDMNDWVGLTAIVTIQHDTYEGETRAAIGKVVAA